MHFPLNLYDSLTLNDAVQPADLIFVMAGRMERKRYGIELYRNGIAPRLVLSVGRFEVSKMSVLGLERLDELKTFRDRTPPGQRHFFVEMRAGRVCIEIADLPIWNTYGEVFGLRRLLEREAARKVIIVSTDVHLRRVSLSIRKVLSDLPVQIAYCPVPYQLAPVKRDHWFVVMEAIKLAGYRLILRLPASGVRWLMGARRRRSRVR